LEFLKDVILALVGPAAAIAFAAIAGQQLTVYWATRQKRRELAITSANEFYRLYGEFFAVWKLWNYAMNSSRTPEKTQEDKWTLLQRAVAAEAGVEAMLVKLAAERALDPAEREATGRFRQGYQSLRQAIRDGKPIEWRHSENPQYLAFKGLACEVASLVANSERGKLPSPQEASEALITITANRWEASWWERSIGSVSLADYLASGKIEGSA
jgi:hypothetical protein